MGQPFSRIATLSNLYLALVDDKVEDAFRLSGLANYQSRGHGKNKPFIKSHFSNKSKQAGRSKYMPHQGDREIAHRKRQDKAATLKLIKAATRMLDSNPVPVPHSIRGAINYG